MEHTYKGMKCYSTLNTHYIHSRAACMILSFPESKLGQIYSIEGLALVIITYWLRSCLGFRVQVIKI